MAVAAKGPEEHLPARHLAFFLFLPRSLLRIFSMRWSLNVAIRPYSNNLTVRAKATESAAHCKSSGINAGSNGVTRRHSDRGRPFIANHTTARLRGWWSLQLHFGRFCVDANLAKKQQKPRQPSFRLATYPFGMRGSFKVASLSWHQPLSYCLYMVTSIFGIPR